MGAERMTPKQALSSALGGEASQAASETLRALLRRDWAVRVLDAWRAAGWPTGDADELDEQGYLYICEWQTLARMGQIRDRYEEDPDAARMADALAVFPTLDRNAPNWPGECP